MTPPTEERAKLVYKICRASDWQEAEARGTYRGSAHDERDGFIHFSYAHQLAETARKHFAGQTDLVVLEIPVDSLAPLLRDELSRGGELFPHLYGTLSTRLVSRIWPLPWDGHAHVLPATL